jgi:hypothetical protein
MLEEERERRSARFRDLARLMGNLRIAAGGSAAGSAVGSPRGPTVGTLTAPAEKDEPGSTAERPQPPSLLVQEANDGSSTAQDSQPISTSAQQDPPASMSKQAESAHQPLADEDKQKQGEVEKMKDEEDEQKQGEVEKMKDEEDEQDSTFQQAHSWLTDTDASMAMPQPIVPRAQPSLPKDHPSPDRTKLSEAKAEIFSAQLEIDQDEQSMADTQSFVVDGSFQAALPLELSREDDEMVNSLDAVGAGDTTLGSSAHMGLERDQSFAASSHGDEEDFLVQEYAAYGLRPAEKKVFVATERLIKPRGTHTVPVFSHRGSPRRDPGFVDPFRPGVAGMGGKPASLPATSRVDPGESTLDSSFGLDDSAISTGPSRALAQQSQYFELPSSLGPAVASFAASNATSTGPSGLQPAFKSGERTGASAPLSPNRSITKETLPAGDGLENPRPNFAHGRFVEPEPRLASPRQTTKIAPSLVVATDHGDDLTLASLSSQESKVRQVRDAAVNTTVTMPERFPGKGSPLSRRNHQRSSSCGASEDENGEFLEGRIKASLWNPFGGSGRRKSSSMASAMDSSLASSQYSENTAGAEDRRKEFFAEASRPILATGGRSPNRASANFGTTSAVRKNVDFEVHHASRVEESPGQARRNLEGASLHGALTAEQKSRVIRLLRLASRGTAQSPAPSPQTKSLSRADHATKHPRPAPASIKSRSPVNERSHGSNQASQNVEHHHDRRGMTDDYGLAARDRVQIQDRRSEQRKMVRDRSGPNSENAFGMGARGENEATRHGHPRGSSRQRAPLLERQEQKHYAEAPRSRRDYPEEDRYGEAFFNQATFGLPHPEMEVRHDARQQQRGESCWMQSENRDPYIAPFHHSARVKSAPLAPAARFAQDGWCADSDGFLSGQPHHSRQDAIPAHSSSPPIPPPRRSAVLPNRAGSPGRKPDVPIRTVADEDDDSVILLVSSFYAETGPNGIPQSLPGHGTLTQPDRYAPRPVWENRNSGAGLGSLADEDLDRVIALLN